MKQKAQKYRQVFLALHGKNERQLAANIKKAIRSDFEAFWMGNITETNYDLALLKIELKETEKVLFDFYVKAGTQWGEMVKRSINTQVKRNNPFFSELWTNYVNRYILPDLRGKITTIKNTLIADISKIIAEKLNEGVVNISKEILKFVNTPKFYKWQAMRIARTETTIAMNTATNQAGIDSGVLIEKEWISAGDGNERPSHRELNGDSVELGQAFSNGLMYPGDPSGAADEIINCRCTFLQVPVRDKNGDIIFTT